MKLLDLILNRNREAKRRNAEPSVPASHAPDAKAPARSVGEAGASSDGMKYLSEMHQVYIHLGCEIQLWDFPPVTCQIDGEDFPLRGEELLSMGRALQSAIHFINSDIEVEL